MNDAQTSNPWQFLEERRRWLPADAMFGIAFFAATIVMAVWHFA